jgi:hypothetical protein
MKIYAVVTTVKELASFWDVIRYFSEDKEKCEKFMKENDWSDHHKIKEYDSETKLDVARPIIW